MQYHFAIRDDLGFGGKRKTPNSKKIILSFNIKNNIAFEYNAVVSRC